LEFFRENHCELLWAFRGGRNDIFERCHNLSRQFWQVGPKHGLDQFELGHNVRPRFITGIAQGFRQELVAGLTNATYVDLCGSNSVGKLLEFGICVLAGNLTCERLDLLAEYWV